MEKIVYIHKQIDYILNNSGNSYFVDYVVKPDTNGPLEVKEERFNTIEEAKQRILQLIKMKG